MDLKISPWQEFDLQTALRFKKRAKPMTFGGVSLTTAQVFGRRVFFATDLKRDPIQRKHRAGSFYEETELDALRKHVPFGSVFVDIGANVGNHSLFAALFLNAKQVIPFEPNKRCYRLLYLDALLNDVDQRYDFSFLGMGLSDEEGEDFGLEDRTVNLGATKMLKGQGDLHVTTGDAALKDVMPDFIKIDVEGMEMKVLRGLSNTLSRAKPKMLIEVDEKNYAAFDAWSEGAGYEVLDEYQRYKTNKNFLLVPKDGVGA